MLLNIILFKLCSASINFYLLSFFAIVNLPFSALPWSKQVKNNRVKWAKEKRYILFILFNWFIFKNKRAPFFDRGLYISRDKSSLAFNSYDSFKLWAIFIDSLFVLVKLSNNDLFYKIFPEEFPSYSSSSPSNLTKLLLSLSSASSNSIFLC